jgi:hypothetical protein
MIPKALGLVFHVFHFRTRFGWYRGRPIQFSCFALSDSIGAVQRASGPVFMFYAPGLVSGSNEGVRSNFTCFALPDSLWAEQRAPSPNFMYYAPKPVFDGSGGIMSHFYVLRPWTYFRRYQGS